MKNPKKFSRFIFFILFILESVTLVIVIGFLFALLNRSMSLEHQHKAEAHQNELRYFLKDRIDHVQNRVEEIVANNGIRVGLLLKMHPKIDEILNLSYPTANGSAFFVRAAEGDIFPAADNDYAYLNDLDLKSIDKENLTRIKVAPAIIVLAMPIVRQGYILGHAVGVYDISTDRKCHNLIHTFRHTVLAQQDQGRLKDLGTGEPIPWSKAGFKQRHLPDSRSALIETHQDAKAFILPVIDFPDLFLLVSTQPLTAKKKELLINLFLLCLPILALTLTVSFLIIRKITSPLDTMAKNAMEIARTRSSENLSIDRIKHFEFFRLATAFNRLLGRVRQQNDQLREVNQELLNEVNERKRVATALASSEAQLRSLQDNIPIGLFRSTIEGRMLFANPTLLQIMGFESRDAFLKTNAQQLYLNPDDRRKMTEDLERVGTVQNRRIHLKRQDGSPLWAHVHVKMVQNPEDGTVHMDGAIQDISPLIEAEEEKQRLESQLRQAQKMETIGTLAGGIAHDFNNILAAISGFCELALEDATAESIQADNLQWALEATNRATGLVRQILAFARQSDEKKHPVRVDLIIKETIKFLRSTLPSTIEVRENIKSEAVVMADPTQLHQVIANLCSNAGYAMRNTGGALTIQLQEVTLETTRTDHGRHIKSGKHLKLSIIDTGHGIPAETLARIFDPYFTTKPQGEGTGIGLSVVQGIIHSHGGFVTVDSAPDKGTRCDVHLPIVDEQALANIETPAAIIGGDEHILMVDDELSIINMGKQILERLGYTVTSCCDAQEALALFETSPQAFDLVITDLTMPKMTGDQLARKMVAIKPDLPLILCTGYSNQRTHYRAAGFGVNAIIYKPLIKRELAETIRRLLDHNLEQSLN